MTPARTIAAILAELSELPHARDTTLMPPTDREAADEWHERAMSCGAWDWCGSLNYERAPR